MKTAQYLSQEKAIVAADIGGIRQRWMYGLRLLRDPEAMSPGGGGLRHGVAAKLIAAAKARGLDLSEREIRYRLQAAKRYPTEAQIGTASADFKTWTDLRNAGFPRYPVPDDEPLADHRTSAEKHHAAGQRMLDLVGEQGTLFPLDTFEPTESTLKDLVEYRDQQRQITARFAERDRKRDDYLEAMLLAVADDLSATWAQAHRAAFGEEVDA